MKFTSIAILLSLASVSALQGPIQKAGIAATFAAGALLGGPLPAPANDFVKPTTVVLDIKADIEPVAAAKNLFAHRNQLADAAKDFVASAQKLRTDLDGVFPPAPEVAFTAPTDPKQAVLDALAGQGRLVVNDQPVYFEVDSQEGFFTFKVISPVLPQLPFLTPTEEQRASMILPRAPVVAAVKAPEAAAAVATAASTDAPFWEWSFQIPVVNKDVTVLQASEVAAGVVVGAYATTFGYYTVTNILDEKQAAEKKKANQAKAAARKKAEAAKKAMATEVEGEMSKIGEGATKKERELAAKK